eukprot:scaffold214927_cov16-Prasinocladus_malaysianus.AAC.1
MFSELTAVENRLYIGEVFAVFHPVVSRNCYQFLLLDNSSIRHKKKPPGAADFDIRLIPGL